MILSFFVGEVKIEYELPNWKLPKKSKSCRYDLLIEMSFS